MLGLDLGARSLIAYQLALSTAANNIANANTPGYSRQRVILSANPTFNLGNGTRIGTGVSVANVERISDEFLVNRVRVARQGLGRLTVQSRKTRELESLFNDLNGTGLSSLLGGFFNSVRGLAASPSDLPLRTSTLEAASSLSTGFKSLNASVERLERDVLSEIRVPVEKANSLLSDLNDLNLAISSSELQGGTASALRDQRNVVLGELAEILDIEVLERNQGRIDVLVGGRLLANRKGFVPLEAEVSDDGEIQILAKGSNQPLNIRDGQLKGFLDFAQGVLDGTRDDLDSLARNLIFELNQRHSTGLSLDGGYRSLSSEFRASDVDGSGDAADDLLSAAGLVYPPSAGELYVSLVNEATGELTRTRIDVDPDTQSLRDLATALDAIDNFSASADTSGRLFLRAANGYRFDFSPRLDPNPDAGAFGNGAATLTSSASFPASLSVGDSFTIEVDGGSAQTITIAAPDFADPSNATAQELADVINRDATGVTAEVVEGRLVLRSDTTGTSSSLLLTDTSGTPAASLGLSTSLETGSELSVSIETEGSYTGSENDRFTFVPLSSGRIGETDGLQVEVRNQAGDVVAVLDVGADYTPGTALTVSDGVQVSFSAGEIGAASGDFFELDVLADSDTSNVLASLGVNAFFAGTGASSIRLAQNVLDDPSAIAASLGGGTGDGNNLLRILDLEVNSISELSGHSFESFYGTLSSRIGFEGRRVDQLFTTQETLHNLLEAERDQVSGVSLDEETLNLVQFQQTFEALTRFVQAVNETTDQLLLLVS